MKRTVDLMLDSGAYSAWTLNSPINVKDYIAWIKDHQNLVWKVIALDVLPGEFGKPRTASDVEKAAKGSYRNLQVMKEAGIEAIPVFHRGESWEWLERMLKDGETYIGISPLVDSKEEIKVKWLDKVFSRLTNADGTAIVRVHGFGVTNPPLMMRYPWHSVDSTSWVKSGGFGFVYVPQTKGGSHEFDYTATPIRFHVSDASKAKPLGVLDLAGPSETEAVLAFLESEGFSQMELRYSRVRRCACCLAYYNQLIKHLPMPFHPDTRSRSLINYRPFEFQSGKIKGLGREFYLFHSTDLSNNQGFQLTEFNCRHRLLSYFELRDCKEARIRAYVKYGLMDRNYVMKQPPVKWSNQQMGWRKYDNWRRLKLQERRERYRGEKSPT